MTESGQDFLGYLKGITGPVHQRIDDYLPNKNPKRHYDIVREYVDRKGKYFRPGLVLLACELFGGDKEKAIQAAAAMQASEDWILIHDDIQDHSDERRGKPCLHHMVGEELAINAGDVLHMIMWKMIKDNDKILDKETYDRLFQKFYDFLIITGEGQFHEISWVYDNKVDVSEEDYMEMIFKKTVNYTVMGPLHLGAIVAGATDEQLKALEEISIPFGTAFQIWDDVMNLTVDSTKQGKERGGDILEGKRTLILVHLLKNCNPEEKQKVIDIIAKKRENKTEEEKNYVLELMDKYGSIEYAGNYAKELQKKSLDLFDNKYKDLIPECKAKDIIREGMKFVVGREH
ncbi:MAG: polyprenyl synthetase family protein [Candidatus Diapherotrites archaeon]|nr:polyprenyl synthetase family protein [Candidatus Diapherotrites archaeon]